MARNNKRTWRYKNTFFLFVSLVLLFLIIDTPSIQRLLDAIGTYGYLGSFITGLLMVSTFTVVPATLILFHLAQELNPLVIALTAGAGSVVGDYILFRFLRDSVFDELKPLFKRMGGSYLMKLFVTPYFSWFAPVLGALIIMSPFPDELGISLMGVSKLSSWKFLILAFLLDFVGILFITTLARSL